ncbi:MAG: primase [Mucilaginibacter sp.]|nr:primase [Mucilaginibacter sp.]
MLPFFMSEIMKNTIKARDVKENVSIVGLLSNLGFEPVRKSGKEHVFFSMFRDENTPSFFVYDKGGKWCDKGDGTGGNIIDLGKIFWKDLSFQEVLEKIVDVTGASYSLPVRPVLYQQKSREKPEPNYQILDIRELGLNQAITDYLQYRGIWLEAQGKLKEVYYYVEDEQKQRKHFFAAGWQNENGSWEIRSTLNFKACLGHKGVSFIPGSERSLAVFEGFMDYLSWRYDNPFAGESVLVLNSVNLLQRGIDQAADFEQVSIFFDHDPTGRAATKAFMAAVPQTMDCSPVYEGYNDYNDKIVAGMIPLQMER